MANFYVSSVAYTAVAQWAATHAYVSTSNGGRGDYVRQLAAPAAGSERVFRCTTSGTSLGAEPAWVLTRNATTTESGGPVWTECTGQEADQVAGTMTAPHNRIANAGASGWAAAGDNIFVSDAHAYSVAAAYSPALTGTATAPNRIVCIKAALANVPPVFPGDGSSGAAETTTGTSSMTFTGSYYWDGINLNCGTGSGSATLNIGNTSNSSVVMRNCTLAIVGTSSSASIKNSTSASVIFDIGVKLSFGAAGQSLQTNNMTWRNTASGATAGTVPTNFMNTSGMTGLMVFEALDLSAINTTFAAAGNYSANTTILIKDCAISTSVAFPNSTAPGGKLSIIRSTNDSTTAYVEKYIDYYGGHVPDITVVRSGTADPTPVSRKITTTANCTIGGVFSAAASAIKNTKVGLSSTATIYGITSLAAMPLNSELWLDVVYLGSSGTPWTGLLASTRVSNPLTAGSALTADTSSWDGGATAWAPSTPYTVGTIRKASGTNAGRLFIVTSISGSGTSGGSDPFAGLVDGGSVTDNPGGNQVIWQAMWRFSIAQAFTAQLSGYVYCYVRSGKASVASPNAYWIDPPVYLS